jgi:ATP-dependent DNA ligase
MIIEFAEKLMGNASGAIQFGHRVQGGSGKAFFVAAEKLGLEGMVSKRASAP